MPLTTRNRRPDSAVPRQAALRRAVNPQGRLRWLGAALVAAAAVIMLRVGWINLVDGPEYRQAASQPLVETTVVPAVRGRILARDGTVLAHDEPSSTLMVHYRWLQSPADPAWVRTKARSMLSPRARRNSELRAAAEAKVLAQRGDLRARLLSLGVIDAKTLTARGAAIQTRVERVADEVQRRRLARHLAAERESDSMNTDDDRNAPASDGRWARWQRRLARSLSGAHAALPPPRIVVAEQLAHYAVAEGVPASVVAEIEGHPAQYPGVRIETRHRRSYPRGELAAHVLGHIGHIGRSEALAAVDAAAPDGAPVGLMGIERQYDALLRGTAGRRVIQSTRSGDELSAAWQPAPVAGGDVTLTLDVQAQAVVEALLDRATADHGSDEAGGGAAIVLDVDTGAILALASAPRFSPGFMSAGAADHITAVLENPRRPLFDRASRMALPPGGALRPLTAAALLTTGSAPPDRLVACNGQHPSCPNLGHGGMQLAEALAVGCDDYFASLADALPPELLPIWLRRFGLGTTTGLDLPGEVDGFVPSVNAYRENSASADSRALAVGQGQLLATPVQLARAIAALARGGAFVRPHVTLAQSYDASATSGAHDEPLELGPVDESELPPSELTFDPAALDLISTALVAAVRPRTSGVRLASYEETAPCAGVCAQAAVDAPRRPHVWFAGYAPADEPRVVVILALEHATQTERELLDAARTLFDFLARQGHLGPGFVPVRAAAGAGAERRTVPGD